MYEVSGEMTAIPITIRRLQKLGKDLAVSKQTPQKFDGERFNLRKLNMLEVRKQYLVEITNRFPALGNLNDNEDINRSWENIKENIKISVREPRSE
jgi:hypothetical protein